MPRNQVHILLLLANLSAVSAFAPLFGAPSQGAMVPMAPSATTLGAESFSSELSSGAGSLLLSVVEETETVSKQGLINFDNPGEAIIGSITLLYIAFSIAAGIKYVVVDGYRPKL